MRDDVGTKASQRGRESYAQSLPACPARNGLERTSYRSRAAARKAAKRQRGKRHAYECSVCSWWHLTRSEPQS